MKRWGFLILISAVMPLADMWAACLGHKSTEVTVAVDRCELVVPEAHPALKAFAKKYSESFVESGRVEAERTVARIFDSYRGAILLEHHDGVTPRIFVPSKDSKVCSRFKRGAKIRALVNDACCDGDPNPPCYLGFGAYIEKILTPQNSG